MVQSCLCKRAGIIFTLANIGNSCPFMHNKKRRNYFSFRFMHNYTLRLITKKWRHLRALEEEMSPPGKVCKKVNRVALPNCSGSFCKIMHTRNWYSKKKINDFKTSFNASVTLKKIYQETVYLIAIHKRQTKTCFYYLTCSTEASIPYITWQNDKKKSTSGYCKMYLRVDRANAQRI